MADLAKFYSKIEASLLASAGAAGELESGTSIGRARELLAAQFLEQNLPARISVRRGEIFDSFKESSGETDVILVDNKSSAARVGGESLVPVEAAIGMIEVKSSLNGDNFKDAIKKIARVKKLQRGAQNGTYRKSSNLRPKIPIPPRRLNGYIVAYAGPQWSTLKEKLENNVDWVNGNFMTFGPEIICILGRGFFLKNDFHYGHPTEEINNHLDAILCETRVGLQEIVYHVNETIHRYGDLSYNLNAYF